MLPQNAGRPLARTALSEGPRLTNPSASIVKSSRPQSLRIFATRKFGVRLMTNSRAKADQEPGQDQKQDQERGTPCLSLAGHRIPMGVCSLATSVAKKPADAVNGLSRHILDRQRAACLRYSTIPLTAPIFFAIFQPTQTLIPLVYDAPVRRGLNCP